MNKELFKKKFHNSPFPNPTQINKKQLHEFSPKQWNEYFDSAQDIKIPNTNDIFRIYMCNNPKTQTSYSTLVLIHGGGYSSLTWALCAKYLKEKFNLIAIDLRAHGESKTEDESNLSESVLVNDVLSVLKVLCDKKPKSFVFIGHSLGGAIAVRAALKAQETINDLIKVAGCVAIDIVEGTALAALPSMHNILNKRPKEFKNIESAIKWTISSGTLQNIESARISVPSQFVKTNTGTYVWRTNLQATEKFWEGWYKGLSEQFLKIKSPKMLLLAGTDRLDKELTIAQMQGKFVFKVLSKVGHVVQEDDPQRTAAVLIDFIERFQL